MGLDSSLDRQIKYSLLTETKEIFDVGFIAAPLLFVGFWVVDLIHSPQNKWEFLGLRIFHSFCVLGFYFFSKKNKSMNGYVLVGVLWATIAGNIIAYMAIRTGGVNSQYQAGLNLVALLTIFFLPYRPLVLSTTLILIYCPFYFYSYLSDPKLQTTSIIINCSFAIGTILAGVVIRRMGYRTRISEVETKLRLAMEIADREIIIAEKSQESVKLSKLSNQFSPQVVEAIRSGSLTLAASAKRSEICCIFIDIVNSTERVVRVDKDKVHRVFSMFLEDTVKLLLKYDITIDKFLGDGILAFSNDPAKHDDFVERTVKAALEIKQKIESRQEEYENNWLNSLKIRIGIATGYANVGFYGNDRYYKCYTAIGPVVNLACRLSSIAEPDQILICNDSLDKLPLNTFHSNYLGKKTLKGFEQDLIKVHELHGFSNPDRVIATESSLDCPSCHDGILFLDTEDNGQYIFRCRTCGYTHDTLAAPESNSPKKVA